MYSHNLGGYVLAGMRQDILDRDCFGWPECRYYITDYLHILCFVFSAVRVRSSSCVCVSKPHASWNAIEVQFSGIEDWIVGCCLVLVYSRYVLLIGRLLRP